MYFVIYIKRYYRYRFRYHYFFLFSGLVLSSAIFWRTKWTRTWRILTSSSSLHQWSNTPGLLERKHVCQKREMIELALLPKTHFCAPYRKSDLCIPRKETAWPRYMYFVIYINRYYRYRFRYRYFFC